MDRKQFAVFGLAVVLGGLGAIVHAAPESVQSPPRNSLGADLNANGNVITDSTGPVQLGGPCSSGATGDVCIPQNERFYIDADGDSYIYCSADDDCWLFAGGAARLRFGTVGLVISTGVTSGSTLLWDLSNASRVRPPRQISTSSPTEPVACSANEAGIRAYVDDTNDSAAAQECICWGTTDDGAGNVTYDWVRTTDFSTACGFF